MIKCIVLIIISNIQLVILQNTNDTIEYRNFECPLKFIRQKRAPQFYTRWQDKPETTQEFIVKVVEDDLTTQIIGVNIDPLTNKKANIIVGAPLQYPGNLQSDQIMDYTRFVVPLPTVEKKGDFAVPSFPSARQDKIFLRTDKVPKNPLRDESPPASPQFISRKPILLARQFAPIPPVTFSRNPRFKPESWTPNPFYNVEKVETEPLPVTDELVAEKSSSESDEVKVFQSLIEDEIMPSERTFNKKTLETFVTTEANLNDLDEYEKPTTRKVIDSRRQQESNKLTDDPDAHYNMLLYDDGDGDPKNTTQYYEHNINRTEDHNNTGGGHQDTGIAIGAKDKIELEQPITDEIDFYNTAQSKVTLATSTTKSTKKRAENIKISKPRQKSKLCNLLKLRQLNFDSPRTLAEIVSQMKKWADESPIAKWVDITGGNLTTMENPIYMMMVDDPSSGQIASAKKTVMIVAGIQGSDHHAVASAMYILNQLIALSDRHTDLLSRYRFWIIPVFNPDGYDYSLTFPQKREWLKNLRQHWRTCKRREECKNCDLYGVKCVINPCYGVNLDRNFEYQWIPAAELRSEHPCGPLYSGPRQLSEPETQAITQYLHHRQEVFVFIALKEGPLLGVLYPYSHTKKKRTYDHIHYQRAAVAASAASNVGGRAYVAGQTSTFLPLYAGGIEDWVDGHMGTDNTYTVMMYTSTTSKNARFEIERVVHEVFAAIDTLLLLKLDMGIPRVMLRSGTEYLMCSTTGLLLAFTTLLLIFLNILLSRDYIVEETSK